MTTTCYTLFPVTSEALVVIYANNHQQFMKTATDGTIHLRKLDFVLKYCFGRDRCSDQFKVFTPSELLK